MLLVQSAGTIGSYCLRSARLSRPTATPFWRHAAITGLTFNGKPFAIEQNLDVEQTLRAYTRDAAYCLQLDDAGVLRQGMLGDCVMFDIDPFTADWIRRPPRVIVTIVGGEVVFDETT